LTFFDAVVAGTTFGKFSKAHHFVVGAVPEIQALIRR